MNCMHMYLTPKHFQLSPAQPAASKHVSVHVCIYVSMVGGGGGGGTKFEDKFIYVVCFDFF